jgi:hypothetical protein
MMQTINIQNGGTVEPGETFAWTTNVAQSGIFVYAQLMSNGQPWFTPNCPPDGPPPTGTGFTGPATGPLPDNSNVVTAADAISPPSGWTYTSNVLSGTGHVVVQTMHPERRKAG